MRLRLAAAAVPLILILAACSSGASSPTPTTAPSIAAPSVAASEAAPSEAAPSAAASSGATGGLTVDAKPVGSAGTILVAGSNGMTVYTFTKDVKDSGKSACTEQCIAKWPALTVASGETPSGGAGLTGKLGTITREDDGTLQVTYNGMPLYFFAN